MNKKQDEIKEIH